MRNYHLIALAGILISGCTSMATTNERSDRQAIKPTSAVIHEQKREPVTRLARQPGPKDTDGKPGEPNCADCDGNGPTYLASIRPSP